MRPARPYLGVIFAGGPRERTPDAGAGETLAGRRARKVGVFATRERTTRSRRIAAHGGARRRSSCTTSATPERVAALRAATGAEIWAVVRTADG